MSLLLHNSSTTKVRLLFRKGQLLPLLLLLYVIISLCRDSHAAAWKDLNTNNVNNNEKKNHDLIRRSQRPRQRQRQQRQLSSSSSTSSTTVSSIRDGSFFATLRGSLQENNNDDNNDNDKDKDNNVDKEENNPEDDEDVIEENGSFVVDFACRLELCVCTEAQLTSLIASASVVRSNPTEITLCRNTVLSLSRELDFSNKAIEVQCGLLGRGGGGRSSNIEFLSTRLQANDCVWNAQGQHRIATGSNVYFSATGVSFFNGRSTTKQNGGAFEFTDNSVISLDNCQLLDNEAPEAAGGAVSLVDNSILQLQSVNVQGNSANDGGAIALFGDSKCIINGNTYFRNNQASSAGAMIISQGSITATGAYFYDNTAQSIFGGAIAGLQLKMTLAESAFRGNTANGQISNIYIVDDLDPSLPTDDGGGTLVTCNTNVVFCEDQRGITDVTTTFDNTNCDTNGLLGTPGQGVCA